MTLEAFNAAIGEIPNIAKVESGGEQAEESAPAQALTGKAAWAMAQRLLKKSKTRPPSAR
jgi:hypothetical protein